jgi:hypothetical protein
MPGTSPQAVTAVEMMGFGTSKAGVTAFASSPSLLGDLGTSYVGAWIGDTAAASTQLPAGDASGDHTPRA